MGDLSIIIKSQNCLSTREQRAPQPNGGLTLASEFDPARCKVILGTATEFSLIQQLPQNDLEVKSPPNILPKCTTTRCKSNFESTSSVRDKLDSKGVDIYCQTNRHLQKLKAKKADI